MTDSNDESKNPPKGSFPGRLAWDITVELRKEILESQKLRAQIIGAKVTFVSAAIGVLAANTDKVPPSVLAVPAFAAIFLDFLVASYSFSVKRIGFYLREHLEKVLRIHYSWPEHVPLWEEFMNLPNSRQRLSLTGNLGITALATGVGILGVAIPWQPQLPVWAQAVVIVSLVTFFALSVRAYVQPWKFGERDL